MIQNQTHLTTATRQKLVDQVIANDVSGMSSIINDNNNIASCNTFEINGEAGVFTPCKLILPTKNLSLMHVAAFCDSLECFIVLEEITSLTITSLSADSLHPIHYACAGNSLEIVSYILTKCPEEARVDTPYRYSLFLCVVASGYKSNRITKLLIQSKTEYPSRIPKQDEMLAPINKAIVMKDIPNLRTLLKFRNNQVKLYTPIMTAVIYKHFEAVKLLIEAGDDILYTSQEGRSALSIACFMNERKGDQDSMESIIKILLQATMNMSIEPPNYYISTETGNRVEKKYAGPVHWMCRSKSPNIVKLFLRYHPEVDINRVDDAGQTGPSNLFNGLMQTKDMLEILTLFVKFGFDINQCNPDIGQKSLLQMAAASNSPRIEIIQFLLDNGADMYLPYVGNKDLERGIANRKQVKKMSLFEFVMENGRQIAKDVFITYAAKKPIL